jgi:hypothetical protein
MNNSYSYSDHLVEFPTEAVCPKCGKVCNVVEEDFRFGYTYGSETGVAGSVETVSDCCGVVIRPSDLTY